MRHFAKNKVEEVSSEYISAMAIKGLARKPDSTVTIWMMKAFFKKTVVKATGVGCKLAILVAQCDAKRRCVTSVGAENPELRSVEDRRVLA